MPQGTTPLGLTLTAVGGHKQTNNSSWMNFTGGLVFEIAPNLGNNFIDVDGSPGISQ